MRAIPRGTWQHRHIPVEKTVTANTAYTAVTVGHGAGTVLDLDIHGSPVPILSFHRRTVRLADSLQTCKHVHRKKGSSVDPALPIGVE